MNVYFIVAAKRARMHEVLSNTAHDTKLEAEAEAKNAARANPGSRYVVLKAVSGFVVDGLTEEQAV